MYFTSDEFENRIQDFNGTPKTVVEFEELGKENYDEAFWRPVDGKLVRAADSHFAAFVEADCSIQYGITSNHLAGWPEKHILALYPDGRSINGINVASFFREFE